MYKKILVAVSFIALMISVPAWANEKLEISSAEHFPAPGSADRDRGDNLTALLLDGDVNTISYTTSSYSTNAHGEQCIGFALSESAEVGRLRIYKFYGALDNWIYYTTDTDTDLGQRTWQPVTGLTNGYMGTELVNLWSGGGISGNQIIGDIHNGWYSVVFDAVNATGIAIGFLTNADAGSAGDLHLGIGEAELYAPSRNASVPIPADGADSVSLDTGLSWTPGASLTGQNVLISTDPDPNLLSPVASGDGTLATVSNATLGGPLLLNTTYFWRVDGIAEPNTFEGAIWSFTTSSKAIEPVPADGGSASGPSVVLSWTGVPGIVYDVHFGADPGMLSQIESDLAVETTTVDSLADATEYFWRVDTYETGGELISLGNLWSFTTTGLYHHWKLDEDPNDPSVSPVAQDYGLGDVTGILSATGVKSVIDPDRGRCLDFSGGSVTFGTGMGIDLAGKSFTLSVWGKKDNASEAALSAMIGYGGVWFGGDSDDFGLGLSNAGSVDVYTPQETTSYYNDAWNMYTVTWDEVNNEATLYSNGVKINSVSADDLTYTGDWALGNRDFSPEMPFNGLLQDARVYVGNLSNVEVANLYLATSDAPWICVNPPELDSNDNCIVDLYDLAIWATKWLTCNRVPVESCN